MFPNSEPPNFIPCQRNKYHVYTTAQKLQKFSLHCFLIETQCCFADEVQKTSLQDAELGRKAPEEHKLQGQPQKICGSSVEQQCGKGQQNVHQGTRPKLSL